MFGYVALLPVVWLWRSRPASLINVATGLDRFAVCVTLYVIWYFNKYTDPQKKREDKYTDLQKTREDFENLN
jgi:hypothetical protein